MKINSRIKFVNEKLIKDINKLKKGNRFDKNLYRSIENSLDCIENNAFSGIQIPKRLIPSHYVKNYGVKNIWKCNLINGWRLIYSIEGHNIKVISIILEYLSHKDYEKRFKY